MKLADFEYHLPPELIAQRPIRPRDRSRLLALDRVTGQITHRRFLDLPAFVEAGDLVVLNDTRVMAARLFGHKEGTGGKAEALLLRPLPDGAWEALVSPGRRVQVGARLVFGEGRLVGEVTARLESGGRVISFSADGDIGEMLEELGQMPLPPYITAPIENRADYQTVYAKYPGSSAAPTAGLHFTPSMLEAIADRGAQVAYVTLHVGLSTFRPIRAEDVDKHEMYPEWCEVPPSTAEAVNATHAAGRRVIAIGTTTARTLEGSIGPDGQLHAYRGETKIFIKPGFSFRALDALVTNFHLPGSTLLLLVCAFGGKEAVLRAYNEAVREGYRFLSFGDAMLIG